MNLGNYSMVCVSTENNIVNVIPIKQFKIKSVYVISTDRAEREGWTERMINLLNESVNFIKIKANKDLEKNIILFSNLLSDKLSGENNLIFNISGGQKLMSLILHNIFINRKDKCNDFVMYTEGNSQKIYIYDKEMKFDSVPMNSNLRIEHILELYNASLKEGKEIFPDYDEDSKKKLEVGIKAYNYFISNKRFRELFFNYMKKREIKDNEIKNFDELRGKIGNMLKIYSESIDMSAIESSHLIRLQNLILAVYDALDRMDINQLEEIRNELAAFEFNYVFDDIKNKIIKIITNGIVSNFESNEIVLLDNLSKEEYNEIVNIINDIEGKIQPSSDKTIYKKDVEKISFIESPGYLFEWMIAGKINRILQKDVRLRSMINSVHYSVKISGGTKDLESEEDPQKIMNAELDIVITTKYGTLIILEMKTFKLKHDVARGKEYLAKKRSGPYGRAIIVSPLLSNESLEDENLYFLPNELRHHEYIALTNGLKFWHIDKIEENFRREILGNLK